MDPILTTFSFGVMQAERHRSSDRQSYSIASGLTCSTDRLAFIDSIQLSFSTVLKKSLDFLFRKAAVNQRSAPQVRPLIRFDSQQSDLRYRPLTVQRFAFSSLRPFVHCKVSIPTKTETVVFQILFFCSVIWKLASFKKR